MKKLTQLLSVLGICTMIAGGLFLLNLVSVSQIITSSPVPTLTPTPTPAQAQKIFEAQIGEDCQLSIATDQTILSFSTNFDPNLAKCDQYSLVRLSDDGQYLVFEDLSGNGTDSLVKIFAYQTQKITLLHDLDKYSILDFVFLPSTKLAVLASDGLKGKQLVYVYDLKYLFDQYLEEAKEGEFSVRAIQLATGELPITAGLQRAVNLKVADQQLQVFAQAGEKPIQSFSLETLTSKE